MHFDSNSHFGWTDSRITFSVWTEICSPLFMQAVYAFRNVYVASVLNTVWSSSLWMLVPCRGVACRSFLNLKQRILQNVLFEWQETWFVLWVWMQGRLKAYADDVLITARTKQSLIDTFQQLKNNSVEVGLTLWRRNYFFNFSTFCI